MNEKPTLSSTSLWATAYAMVRGVRLLEVLPRNGHPRNSFILDNTDNRAHFALQEYWNGTPVCHVRKLLDWHVKLLELAREVEGTPARPARGA
jgi:hypothetical protein